jgi:tripartite-type tricarboxylate transporter receptor subunit TctC
LPIKSVKELIAWAKAKPGELNYASASSGTSNHLAAELFKSMAGVNIIRVPYKGAGPALNAVVANEVPMMFPTAGAVIPLAKAGRIRPLAVTTAQPTALMPGLPTVAMAGLPGFESASLTGVFAPAKTPAAIIRRLNQEIVRILTQADVKEKLFNTGVEVVASTPEQFAAAVKSEIIKMGKLIKDVGIRAD